MILHSSKIDFAKWDNCISLSENGLIYSTSSYLQANTDNWSGLIVGDYEAVLALPWRKKMGIRYLYIPAFIQQLGLIGKQNTITTELLKEISQFVRYGDYFFNAFNEIDENIIPTKSKSNFIISLNKTIEEVEFSYSNELKGYIKRAEKAGLVFENASIDDAITAYREKYSERMPHVTNKDFESFNQFTLKAVNSKKVFAKKVLDSKGTIQAIALFLFDGKRIYNLMPTTFEQGRKKFAMHFLLHSLFKTFLDKPILFDFEGSDLPGVSKFYAQFGAINHPFSFYHFNNLPWLLKLVKK